MMSETTRDETDPTVPWYQRGGFTTLAAISVVLGLICWLAIGLGAIFGFFDLAQGFVPFPAVIGLLFGILGFLGPWKIAAIAGALLNIGAVLLVMLS